MGDEKEKLVLDNMKIAYKLALYYYRKFTNFYELDDLKSVSFMGLIKAANTFNQELNYKFSTYAYACIRTEICNYLSDGRKHQNQIYLSDKIDDADDLCVEDMLADTFDLEEEVSSSIQCRELLEEINKLPGRYSEILKFRMNGMTFGEIGKILGLSQPTISTDYHRAINLLRIKLRDWRWRDV